MLTRKMRQIDEILFIFARTAPTGRAIKKAGPCHTALDCAPLARSRKRIFPDVHPLRG